jgi:hypothetical protein
MALRATARWIPLAEILIIFTLFTLQGAWPVPDVNEPYYLGKAVHYWNQDWGAGDFFLKTTDVHQVFCLACGWMTRWLPLPAVAWTGRLITWALLAWAWRRLSWAVLPRPGWSILTAALFAILMDHFSMAGEWVIGGFEAKGLAYVCMFLGLGALLRGFWNRTWLLLGLAAMFHVLVGGWAVLAASITWLISHKAATVGRGPLRDQRSRLYEMESSPPLRTMLPGLLGGFLLSLPGLIPALFLNHNADAETVRQANLIYVFERLPHHLDLLQIEPGLILRFVLLSILFFLFCRLVGKQSSIHRLKTFVQAVLCLMLVGIIINFASLLSPSFSAGLLKFYWYRLPDVAVPLGAALAIGAAIALGIRRAGGKLGLIAVLALTGWQFGVLEYLRLCPNPPRADRLPDPAAWYAACDWVRANTPPAARFFTPRLSQTFTWYTGRPEAVTWKNIPQDARGIVEWRRRLEEIYATGQTEPGFCWHDNLSDLGALRLEQLARKYGAHYAIIQKTSFVLPPSPDDSAGVNDISFTPLNLPVAYENDGYVIYRLQK